MNWLLLGGSRAGVLALAGLAWWLGLGRSEPLTEEEARERAEFELMPFAAQAVFVGLDGEAALVIGEDGRLLLLKKHGTQPASRELLRPVRWREESGALVLHTDDRRFGDVLLKLDAEARDKLLTLL